MRNGLLAAGLVAALALTGCGGKDDVSGKTAEDITAKSSAKDIGAAYINEMTRIADALETVDDEASAKAAAQTIKVAVDGLNQMSEELDGEISGVKGMQIFGGRYTELIEVQGRVATSMIKIQSDHPELMDTISAEMDQLEN
jgi:outer membrane lipoprotein SlyB